MKYDYCEKCKKECEYIEVNRFIEYINDKYNTCFYHEGCPDQTKKSYTCDLLFKDKNSPDDLLYVEVKRVKFGFGNVSKSNTSLAKQNGQKNCAETIYQTINSFHKSEIIDFFDDFLLDIPSTSLRDKEIPEFERQFICFLENVKIDEEINELSYTYSNNNNNINIYFRRKSEDLKEKFGDRTLYQYELEEEKISLCSIQNSMIDINSLNELIKKNFFETSEKKYPHNAKRKVLLNILELPTGYDIFFNRDINYVIKELLKNEVKNEVITAATEGYLLYNCNDYFEREGKEIKRQYKNTLFIIPIIKGIIDNVVLYYDEVFEKTFT